MQQVVQGRAIVGHSWDSRKQAQAQDSKRKIKSKRTHLKAMKEREEGKEAGRGYARLSLALYISMMRLEAGWRRHRLQPGAVLTRHTGPMSHPYTSGDLGIPTGKPFPFWCICDFFARVSVVCVNWKSVSRRHCHGVCQGPGWLAVAWRVALG